MRQNFTIALLSVVATLLLVLIVQNFLSPYPVVLGQSGGGSATVGPIGIATGPVTGSGDAQAVWIYDPSIKKILVYYLGGQNKLEFRAGRDIQYDMQVEEYSMTGKPHTVMEIKNAVEKKNSAGKK